MDIGGMALGTRVVRREVMGPTRVVGRVVQPAEAEGFAPDEGMTFVQWGEGMLSNRLWEYVSDLTVL